MFRKIGTILKRQQSREIERELIMSTFKKTMWKHDVKTKRTFFCHFVVCNRHVFVYTNIT